MEEIERKHVEVNGLKLHVAEIGRGSSPAVVFLHGFPEIWYSWRHQMIAVAKAGFRVIAPDYRGYGLSDPPPEPEKATFMDLVADLLALLDALSLSKVFLIGKDFGALVVSIFTLLHQDRVLGFATLGVPFMPPRPPTYHQYLPEGFYMSRWKEPGRAEADFGRLDAKTIVKNVYIMFSKSEIPIAHEGQEIMDLVEPSTPLPSWFTEEDLATYGALYEKSGFRTALQVPYRSMDGAKLEINDPKVEVPALLIMGEKDYVFKFPGIEDYIRSGAVKSFVPNLEEIAFMPEGNHFVQEQSPDENFRTKKSLQEMEEIEHKYVQVNGLKLHVAEIGRWSSPAVVFLHGFPEIWYSWRHQMIAVAKAGFRAIAPDYRGYGLSDPPPEPEKTTFMDLVADLLALLDALTLSKVFLIGKDFGAAVVSIFTLLHQDRVLGFATLGVPFRPPGPPTHHQNLPEGFYISRWKEPGRAEADFGRLDAKTVVRNVYIMFSKSEIPIAREGQEIMDLVEPSTPLPSWFTEEDLATYGALYEKSGFQTALQVPYRSMDRAKLEIKDPKVEVPALLIMGEKDYVFKFPGVEDYIRSGAVKSFVPNLEIAFMPEGNHFVQEQSPDEKGIDKIEDYVRVNNQRCSFLSCRQYTCRKVPILCMSSSQQVNKLILNFLKNNSS
ncbi:hypothetical protein BUALT_Bualt03G0062100 [Buddleja alternifolia]|uniref:AB hydrolase-1 domain-containing protein n=1 Tax=Buddleja alternifolia TaxID=168488 RepID=A0AAV6XRH7_9LAMI|nr:hypothetical protein BUALT_Bualt03G0062100 [Buddleja alternifolia]